MVHGLRPYFYPIYPGILDDTKNDYTNASKTRILEYGILQKRGVYTYETASTSYPGGGPGYL